MQDLSLRNINRLAIPAIIAGIAEPLISIADTAIIGNIPGNAVVPLSAVGLGSSFFLLIVWVLAQIKSAISALVARYYGMGKMKSLKALVSHAIYSNMLLGVVFYLVTNYFARDIFMLYNAEGEVLDATVSYFTIRSMGFPLTLGTYAIFGVFRGMQNTSWAMIISLSGGLLNLLLDIVLVYGVGSVIPSYGLEGAAYASLMAQGLMLLMAVVYFYRRTPFNLNPFHRFHPEMKNIVIMSSNLFVRTISLNVAYYLANRFATGYGNNFIAAHTIAMNIWLFSSFFIDGYANAGNAISGKLLGMNRITDLRKLTGFLSKVSVFIASCLAVIYLLGYVFIGSFFTHEQSVIDVFNSIFWLVILSQPINAIAFAYDGIFKGLGRTALLRNTLVLATFVVFVPAIYFADFIGLHIYGIWAAFILWMLARGGTLFYGFNKSYGKPIYTLKK